MMETTIVRLVDSTTAETIARALEDFQGELVTITIKKVVPKQKTPKEEKKAIEKGALTHQANQKMIEEVQMALRRFFGKQVKIVISEDAGDGRKKGNRQKNQSVHQTRDL
jgi:hypothetical protein